VPALESAKTLDGVALQPDKIGLSEDELDYYISLFQNKATWESGNHDLEEIYIRSKI
jgi:hypothetical protein